ncbi:MAG: ABC transporter ATP-binding protein [Acidobacteria bacterium]|nr:ABC transporter ATP-binding protein [Acidobacteriota bacterium]
MLDVRGLQKSFLSPEGESTLIVDVPRFQLAEGEQVAVRGASGSGKTTFLNLIAGILQADKGTIVLAGQTMTSLSESGRDRVRAKTIGYVFQNFNLLQGYTAIENVMLGMLFGSGVDRARAQQLLERVGLSHRVNYRPSQLSIGQQQRVAVARALANRPKLVLADEPTGNLDQRHAGEALELIREACRENGAALLLVSHDPAVFALFDRSEDLADLNQAAAAHAAAPVHTENRTAL